MHFVRDLPKALQMPLSKTPACTSLRTAALDAVGMFVTVMADANCKYPNFETIVWECAGCKANRNRSHTSHTFGPDCQWAIASTRSEGARRTRTGKHPRDPVVKAAAEPTGSLRIESPSRTAGGTSASPAVAAEPSAEAPAAAESSAIPDGSIAPERLTPEEALRRRKEKSERAPAKTKADASTQAIAKIPQPSDRGVGSVQPMEPDEALQPTWSRHDLGAILQQLNSVRTGIVRRSLRKLHIRWFHCGASRMKMLLTSAGVKSDIMALVDEIVETCSICRMWARPGPRSVSSTSVYTRFNQCVQYDLLFFKTHIILHMIDCAMRWSAGCLVENKLSETLINAMDKLWFRVFGSPQELVGDREGGIAEPIASARFLELRGIKLTLKARGQHAFLIERHNEILRQQIHKCDEQATADGLRVDMENILNESLFAKNSLLVLGGYTPYEALYGRTPPIVNVMDAEREDPQHEEDSFRLRMIAVNSMIQATALAKAQRAENSKTRISGELLELKPGDLIDFFRPPSSKDVSGWMGPATVADTTPISQGIIAVRWQGRTIDCRIQDIRRSLVFASFLSVNSGESPVTILRLAVEHCRDSCIRLGWFKQHSVWQSCDHNKQNPKALLAGLYVASVCLGLQGTIGFRYGRGIRTISAVQCDDSFLIWWKAGDMSCWHHIFLPATVRLNLVRLTNLAESELCLSNISCWIVKQLPNSVLLPEMFLTWVVHMSHYCQHFVMKMSRYALIVEVENSSV